MSPRTRSNISPMRRVLLSLLLAWVALAPVLANACAAECEMHSETVQPQDENGAADMDCHGSANGENNSGSSDHLNGMMAAGCLLAATTSVPNPAVVLVNAERVSCYPTTLFLLPPSASSSPPDKPPRA